MRSYPPHRVAQPSRTELMALPTSPSSWWQWTCGLFPLSFPIGCHSLCRCCTSLLGAGSCPALGELLAACGVELGEGGLCEHGLGSVKQELWLHCIQPRQAASHCSDSLHAAPSH